MKLSLLILITFSSQVFAYIDPASGSAILSAIIGLLVAFGMKIKSLWYKLKSLFVFSKDRRKN